MMGKLVRVLKTLKSKIKLLRTSWFKQLMSLLQIRRTGSRNSIDSTEMKRRVTLSINSLSITKCQEKRTLSMAKTPRKSNAKSVKRCWHWLINLNKKARKPSKRCWQLKTETLKKRVTRTKKKSGTARLSFRLILTLTTILEWSQPRKELGRTKRSRLSCTSNLGCLSKAWLRWLKK